MQVTSLLFNLAQFTRVSPSYAPAAPSVAPMATGSEGDRPRVIEQVAMLDAALRDVDMLLRTSATTRVPALATAFSASALNLRVDATATTMTSIEEVNTTPTSFTTPGPAFAGASTAEVTIGGVYDGDQGTGTLTFEVTRSGTHGSDRLRLRVTGPNDEFIENININGNDPIDEVYTLKNGLTLALGAGDLEMGDTFTIDVFDALGSTVDPDKPFDGTRNDDPGLEPGQAVTAGTFDVNGVTITVFANDTINTVAERISASDAGVAAVFDGATERVVLTQTAAGSAHDIVLANDTSGFLSATKLDGAIAVAGLDRDADTPLAQTTAFAGVSSGIISVNGLQFSIDVNTDTLADILARVDASEAGVSATFIHEGQRVRLQAETAGLVLELDDGGTGLFAAVGIDSGSYFGRDEGEGLSKGRSYDVSDGVEHIAAALNELFDDFALPARLDPSLAQLRADIDAAVGAFFPEQQRDGDANTGFGISFALGGPVGASPFVTASRAKLNTALQTNIGQVRAFFLGEPGRPGAASRLSAITGRYLNQYATGDVAPGLLVDLVA